MRLTAAILILIGILATPTQANASTEAIKDLTVSPTAINKADVETLHQRAASGDAESQYQLGLLYLYGNGVPLDFTMYEYWHRKAAKGGHFLAQYYLGQGYALGAGPSNCLPLDPIEGLMWLLLAKQQDQAKRATTLASYLERTMTPEQVATARKRAQDLLRQTQEPASPPGS